jgi:arylsulfatase A-like enzyme
MAPAGLSGCGGGARPNILLIVLDTARADRFPFGGYARPTAPALAALAAEGAVYERACSAGPWTVPSHGSLFTGLYPSQHGADSGHLRLDDEQVTLAERLRDAGYRTLGYTENPWIGKAHNFQQGFQHYEEIWRQVTGTGGEDMGAARVNQRVAEWLDWRAGNPEAQRQPFFMFINYFEPHLPYNPPEPERSRFLTEPVDRVAVERLRRLMNPHDLKYILGLASLAPDERRILSDLYDGEIAYVDRRAGEVVDQLRRRGILDRTVVVVTSDHGESIGEHGLIDHKLNIFEEVLRIPLVLRYPPAIRAGQRIQAPVLLQDLFPTLLGLAGIEAGTPRGWPRDAVPLPGVAGAGQERPRDAGGPGAEGVAEPLVAEYARPSEFLVVIQEALPGAGVGLWNRAQVAWRVGSEKLHWSSDGRHRLFDLSFDPGETRDLAAERPGRVDDLRAAVEAWLRRPGARPPAGP